MNLKPSDLPLLVSLDMLLEERNVTRAASKLHVSQPALSAQLARLRRLFKDPLLVPSETGRGMVPTPKAEEMATALRDALSQLGALGDPSDTFDPSTDGATFRIGGSFSAIGTFAKPLIAALHAWRNSDLRITFRTGCEIADVLARFENGEVDILLAPNEQIPSSLKMRPLMADEFVMLQRKGHPRGTAPVTLDEYCSLGHLVISDSGRTTGLMDDRLKEIGRSRDVLVSAPVGDSIGPILNATDLVCTLPQSMVEAVGPGVEAYAIPFDMPDMSLAMAWHSRLDKQPAHRWLRDELIRVSRTLHPTRHVEPQKSLLPMIIDRVRDGYH
ncbi:MULTISPECIES: LysR family transcriptional regulator [unclassified Luteibacter]|uniref:LysR family transcriptional regulator n=1 Tax=unclassified Luteibacter TaxID=2620188 RepID=UPI0008BDE655|nr:MULTISPECIES: LysR family transcriptional regulator [unclassified Luteibacter]MDR6934913.1 DNA-binding transcriptional LysR family regulator [Luteibacter sp. 3190]SEO84200.1 DNA-binding transcriptional regulator, LysR family [Luteibacter sp. UNC138MFCol5.1]